MSYETLLIALDGPSSDDSTFSYELVKSQFLQEEQHSEIRGKLSESSALLTEKIAGLGMPENRAKSFMQVYELCP